jgi:hypothetical protein
MSLVGMNQFCSCIAVMLAAAGAAFASEATTDWKDEANARIARLRQREVRVRVVNEKGDPAAGISVGIRQIGQAFSFGAAVGRGLLRNERYAEFFKAHFNFAALRIPQPNKNGADPRPSTGQQCLELYSPNPANSFL